jgi:hypothetical protein
MQLVSMHQIFATKSQENENNHLAVVTGKLYHYIDTSELNTKTKEIIQFIQYCHKCSAM